MIKQYPKTHEDLFSTDHALKNEHKLNLNAISVEGMGFNEYVSLYKSFLTKSYSELFDTVVRFVWLRRKFRYHSEKALPRLMGNSVNLCLAFAKFTRRIVGIDTQVVTRSYFFKSVERRIDGLFPCFDDGDPFSNPDSYKFPFKNISIDFFAVVSQLDDWLDFLKLAEEKKMTYAVFVDYVINHVLSENEEVYKRDRYVIKSNLSSGYLFHITDTDKHRSKRSPKNKKYVKS